MIDPPALEMVGVSKRFGEVVALDDASILVRRGTVHALLGENGAGKTTLMRIAFGMLVADQGITRVGGNESRFSRPGDAIAAGVGMVHQHPANVPAMTVAENLELGARGPYRPSSAARSATALAKRVGFDIDPRARVGDLSLAAQQRLEILKAIGRGARILILDEPTAVLAPSEARELLEWLRRFASEGGTAVVITHKLEEARTSTDELTVLRAGKIVLARRSADSTTEALTFAMIGDSLTPALPSTRERAEVDVVASASDLRLIGEQGIASIDGASFDIRRGEIVGIAAVEGSGYRELLLALAGRLRPSGGGLTLPGRTGFVPEDRHRDGAVLDFTLAENVAINGAGARGGMMRWPELESTTAGLLRRFDVRARGPRERMAALSGGNQQKVVLAREVAANPQLLVVENPTRGLDIRAAAFVREQIMAARAAGMAIVYYSSDLDEVIAAADRVLVVFAGRVRWVERDRSLVGAAMLGVA